MMNIEKHDDITINFKTQYLLKNSRVIFETV